MDKSRGRNKEMKTKKNRVIREKRKKHKETTEKIKENKN
jgi:hypothetical protein